MWEDYNVDDVLYVLDNPQKRCANIAGAIPTRSRIIVDIRDEKHGMVIKEPVSDWSLFARQKVYHGYETNVTRTMSMKRDIGGIEM